MICQGQHDITYRLGRILFGHVLLPPDPQYDISP
jgi:hypothetical protein